jgi:hypothetical protein
LILNLLYVHQFLIFHLPPLLPKLLVGVMLQQHPQLELLHWLESLIVVGKQEQVQLLALANWQEEVTCHPG